MFRLPSIPIALGKLVPFPVGGRATVDHIGSGQQIWHRTTRIDGRTFAYGEVVGDGPAVVMVHGWGLSHVSYSRAAEEIGKYGYRVFVPDLPGFGGSSDLPPWKISFGQFAGALERFCDAVLGGAHDPVHLVGHSFGGGVCAQFAHDAPDRVASAVLVDSVAGVTWTRDAVTAVERLLTKRPFWDWGFHLLAEFPVGTSPATTATVMRDFARNVMFHPATLSLVARMIPACDLREHLSMATSAGVPVSLVWASGDHVVTRACYDDQCIAVGCDGLVVDGNHGWPLSDPATFGQVIAEQLAGHRMAA